MSAPIDPKNVGSFSVLNNRVYLTPDFSNRPAARHQRVVEAEKQRQAAEAKKRAERQAEKEKKRPTFGTSMLTGALTVFCFAGISFLFGVPLIGSGLGGLGGLIIFCAWMDYDEKVRKWQERQNAEVNARLEEIRRISAPASEPVKTANQGSNQRLVPKGMEDGVMIYTVEGNGYVSYDWLKSEIERRERQLKDLSTEELLNEIRRREEQGKN